MEQENHFEGFDNDIDLSKNTLKLTVIEAIAAALIVLFGGQMLAIPFAGLQYFVPSLSHLTIPLSYAVSFIGAIFILKLWKQFSWSFILNQFKQPLNFICLIVSILIFVTLLPFVELTTNLIPTSGLNGILDAFYEFFITAFESIFQYKVAAVLTVCVLAPILEEVILRGMILKGMLNNNVTPWVAIVVSALLFGFIHANPWQFVAATLMGIALGYIYYKTKSLIICIILHAINNSASSYVYFKYGMEDLNFVDSETSYYALIIIVGLILSISFGYLLHVLTKNKTSS